MNYTEIFTNQAADGDSLIFESKGQMSDQNKDESVYLVKFTGDFGGGTVTPMLAFDDDDYAPIINAIDEAVLTYTTVGCIELLVKTGAKLKLALSGSTGASLNARVL